MNLPLLQQYAPHYSYSANTIGSWYEFYLQHFETQGFLSIDPNAVNASEVLMVYCVLFANTLPPESPAYPHVVAIYYMSKLSEIVPPTLDSLNYADFENRYHDLMALIRYFRSDEIANVPPDLKTFLPEDEFIDLCEGILFGCKLDAFKAVNDVYVARIGDLKRRQFLSNFLQDEPGVQHKAGVPMGGTFILVYHGDPGRIVSSGGVAFNLGLLQQRIGLTAARSSAASSASTRSAATTSPASRTTANVGALGSVDRAALLSAIGNISANRNLISNDDVSLLIGVLTGQVPIASTTGSGQAQQLTRPLRSSTQRSANWRMERLSPTFSCLTGSRVRVPAPNTYCPRCHRLLPLLSLALLPRGVLPLQFKPKAACLLTTLRSIARLIRR